MCIRDRSCNLSRPPFAFLYGAAVRYAPAALSLIHIWVENAMQHFKAFIACHGAGRHAQELKVCLLYTSRLRPFLALDSIAR